MTDRPTDEQLQKYAASGHGLTPVELNECVDELINARKKAAYSKEYVESTDGVIERLAEKVETLEEQLAAVRKLLDNVGPNSTPEVCAQLARWCADYDAS